ncbi:MAG: ABC transporter permease [Euryarchaeota archaeon]|jgi:neutral amino acid transport system permease protein|nr:ABC transporter permease [Euryarchaeota archaeon]MBT4346054.1 ABC transporter permease [Euryarchaeota archaeon]MBT5280000.1 ABC transporter permease [Euryarchaeota archaeon]MBT6802775.1 ABC transporter permease [Euryarchaeota archaeon]MBT6852959.1 ABC transporter permease [Euryarchaeota archaeon]
MLQQIRANYNQLSTFNKKLILALLLFFDSLFLGLSYGYGLLNILDILLLDKLPTDLIWLLQLLESITAGFIVVKIFFDDLPSSPIRTLAILISPIFMVGVVFLTLESLLQGLDTQATITLDLISISTGTLTWASTYLAIAIGLTLTYKVQRYGNFAQSEFFMIGMYLGMIMVWSDYYFPLYDAPKDGVLTWSLLSWSLIAAFVLTGIAGIIIDRLVYRGFRKNKSSPQVMMIASLGVALILRALTYLRFGASRNMFEPDSDWRMPAMRWELPTTKFRFNLGDRGLAPAEPFSDANGNGVYDGGTNGLVESFIDLDGDNRYDNAQVYTQYNCEQTGIDEATGEPIFSRIISEISKPFFEMYDTNVDCITGATTNYAYYKGIVPAVIFCSVAILLLLLTKTRLGRKMRAVADNPELASSSGINVERVQLTSAFLSAGISGLGGAIFAITLRYNPETAFTLLLPSFAVIVLGTIGSIPGAIIASLIVGFVRALSSPILIGIGSPLDRSNYTALDGVMPYLFLVAVLMIMPEGIGDAYEKWKIDRLRRQREKTSEPSKLVTYILAIFPLTAVLGLHNWWNNRSDRAQTLGALSVGTYVFHRIASFIDKHSFSPGACSDTCASDASVETNLDILLGSDGVLQPEDSPFFSDTLSNIDMSWFDLMQTEIWLIDFISSVDSFVWPLIPILIWMLALIQANEYISEKNPIPKVIKSTNEVVEPGYLAFLGKYYSKINNILKKIIRDYDSIITRFKSIIDTNINNLTTRIPNKWNNNSALIGRLQYGRESQSGSNITFIFLLLVLFVFLYWLPISNSETMNFNKALQVSNVLLTLSIFILMSFSLNLHTGVTGMVNFGVIFFVGIGAITVGILTAPTEVHGYAWPVLPATVVAILLAAAFGWALAYPTARLRMDYFAIVTISLGEILRVLLAGEPLLRVGSIGSAIGISKYTLPLKQWWFCGNGVAIGPNTDYISADSCRDDLTLIGPADKMGQLLNLTDANGLIEPAPYMMLLAIMGIISVLAVWWLLETILSSPWGRILKAIREDEEVAQHHGHDVLSHKAASLALGAGIAGLAGAFWAWKLTGFEPSIMSPARSTFLVWAAFIIGGKANNKGMIVGAFIIVLMEFVFNVLVAAQGSPDLPLYTTADRIDRLFHWLVTSQWEVIKIFIVISVIGIMIRNRTISDVGISGIFIFLFTLLMLGQRSIDESFTSSIVSADMAYVKVFLVGCLMLFSLKLNPKGLIPEVPFRPKTHVKKSSRRFISDNLKGDDIE